MLNVIQAHSTLVLKKKKKLRMRFFWLNKTPVSVCIGNLTEGVESVQAKLQNNEIRHSLQYVGLKETKVV